MNYLFHFNQMESSEPFIDYTKSKINYHLAKASKPLNNESRILVYVDGTKNHMTCKISLDGKKYYDFQHSGPGNWRKIVNRISEKIERQLTTKN